MGGPGLRDSRLTVAGALTLVLLGSGAHAFAQNPGAQDPFGISGAFPPELFTMPDSFYAAPISPQEREQRIFERTHPNLDQVFVVGEKLTFSVRYGVIRAGEATMTIHAREEVNGLSCYHIVTTAGSNNFFSAIFHVRDRLESFIDTERLLPRRFEKHLNEGDYHKDEVVHFDQENHLAFYGGDVVREMVPKAHDILSAFYATRARELEPGMTFNLESHVDKKNYPIKVIVHRRERISAPVGDFDCMVVEPVLRTPGLFKHQGKILVWLTDDARHVPIQMKSELPIGAISVVLVEVGGRLDWEQGP